MRSPLAWLAGAYALGVFLDRLWPEPFWWAWTLAALVGILISWRKERGIRFLILAAVLGLGALSGVEAAALPRRHFLNDSPQASCRIEAQVVSPPAWRSMPGRPVTQQALLRVIAVEDGRWRPACGGLWLRHRRPAFPLQYGDRIQIHAAHLQPIVKTKSWDRWLWLRGADAVVEATGKELEWLDSAHGIRRGVRTLFQFRDRLIWQVRGWVNAPTAATLNAFLLGDRTGLAKEVLNDFRRTGTYHILSVSGWHVTFLGGVLWFLIRLVSTPRLAVALTVTGLVIYCFLVGADPPIVRATLMGCLLLAALWSGRLISPINSIGLAALVILCRSPRSLWDPGFQLSFCCVISLVVVTPLLLRWVRIRPPIARHFWQAVAASFAAWLGSLPLVIYHMHNVSWAAVPANFFLIPMAGLVMATGLIFFAALCVHPGLAWPWAKASQALVFILLEFLRRMSAWPGSYSERLSLNAMGLGVCYGVLLGALWIINQIYLLNNSRAPLDAE
ncbi:MAG: ComEC/Rec2 family competence protein [Candidatus Omnitrophica bacterium]|nr:ComEC/Rec2 family competence protein [Candidatus Omnitrophota bacterium]